MIIAQQVNELRQRTKISMMLCKKALEATNGDQELAIDWLRKNGNSIGSGSDESKSNTFDVETVYNGNLEMQSIDIPSCTWHSPDGKVSISITDTSGDWHTLYSGQNGYFKIRSHKE